MHKAEPEYQELQSEMEERWMKIPEKAKRIIFGANPENAYAFLTWRYSFQLQYWHDKYFGLKERLAKYMHVYGMDGKGIPNSLKILNTVEAYLCGLGYSKNQIKKILKQKKESL